MGDLSVINVVTDHGADNTGASDTSSQILLALASVPISTGPPNIAGGAIVYFPRGTYKISLPLRRYASYTRCVGEGKDATVILLDHATWQGQVSPTDPSRSYVFDLNENSVTDCMISDMRIDGSARSLTSQNGTSSLLYCGIQCSQRDLIERVSIYDVWGYGLWIFGPNAAWTTLVDCEADLGFNYSVPPNGNGGNDTIGGGGVRTKIVRFYWMPHLAKNSALYFTAPGGTSLKDTSADIIDCTNESPLEVVLEGCYQSSVRGSRFYGNNLRIKSDAAAPMHDTITNPMDILVANNLFVGAQQNSEGPYLGGSCFVELDGGIYCPAKTLLNHGGRIAILGNTFVDSAGASSGGSAIRWAGDDQSNSDGGSVIADNRIINPNANGVTIGVNVAGGCPNVSLGSELGCGIAVLSSWGLAIGRNTINDTRVGEELMQYAIQLFSSTGLIPLASMGRIMVEDNLCGSAPGVGNGSVKTFYLNPNPTLQLPLPILRGNTNGGEGYDAAASAELSSPAYNNVPWPVPGGYAYDAYIYVSQATGVAIISIDGVNTGMTEGAFYLAAGHTIRIAWTTQPTIAVFSMAT